MSVTGAGCVRRGVRLGLACVGFGLVACRGDEPGPVGDAEASWMSSPVARDCVANFDPERDYFDTKVRLRHARGFEVSYHGHYKVLRTRPPEESGGGLDVIVLVRCGTPPPPLVGDLEGASVVEIPARSAAANEDLSLTRMRVLGLAERVVGMGSGGVYDRSLRARWEDGSAVEIGASFHGPPRFEVLLEVSPDITFLSTASLANAAPLVRARALGLAAAAAVSWVEPTLLGQAEWLQQVAVFFDAEETAARRLGDIEKRYGEVRDVAAGAARRPVVLWLDPAGGGRWTVPVASWKHHAIVDAGGTSPFGRSDGVPSMDVTSEQILALGDSIDLVLTESVALDAPGSGGPLEALRAFREGRVYSVHRRARPEHDAYDWYESAVVEVDRVLADLVALLHPDLLTDHPFHHIRLARPVESSATSGAP